LLFVAGWYSRRRTSESSVCESAWSKADKRKLLILLATVVQDDLWRFPQWQPRCTKRAAVTRALEEFIARRHQKQVLELFGKLEWDKSCDYKSERSRR
jgi:hypothetical protein